MTPSETKAKRATDRPRRDDGLAALIAACGRDERPALQELYRRTAGRLYGQALAAADRATADKALVQAYLDAFGEAAGFDPARDSATAWLAARLARQLPGAPGPGKGSGVKPVEPPAELWQKLDIRLGLERLDRHIKPGVATQPRGRDPMPNAYDRLIERQLRFWRLTATGALLAFLAAGGAILAFGVQGGPAGLLARPAAAPGPQPAAGPAAAAAVAAAPTDPAPAPAETAAAGAAGAAPWRAILQSAFGDRLWQVRHAAGALEVEALPPFSLPERAAAGAAPRVLVLWALAGPGAEPRRLGDLDPAAGTVLALPAELDRPTLRLVVSLEPTGHAPGAGPGGPLLFAGGRAP